MPELMRRALGNTCPIHQVAQNGRQPIDRDRRSAMGREYPIVSTLARGEGSDSECISAACLFNLLLRTPPASLNDVQAAPRFLANPEICGERAPSREMLAENARAFAHRVEFDTFCQVWGDPYGDAMNVGEVEMFYQEYGGPHGDWAYRLEPEEITWLARLGWAAEEKHWLKVETGQRVHRESGTFFISLVWDPNHRRVQTRNTRRAS